MKMADLIRVAKSACPEEIAWTRGEAYGEYNIEDYNKDVKKVLYCVTATPHVVDYFQKNGYDLLISHHPFRTSVPQLIFHTALDCCEGGLNDQWRDHLQLKAPYKHFDGTLGWHGEIDPMPFQDLVQKVAQFFWLENYRWGNLLRSTKPHHQKRGDLLRSWRYGHRTCPRLRSGLLHHRRENPKR
jgi:putative NIF3 family GTP cyclohydrolase 1 type 2